MNFKVDFKVGDRIRYDINFFMFLRNELGQHITEESIDKMTKKNFIIEKIINKKYTAKDLNNGTEIVFTYFPNTFVIACEN